MIECRSCKSRTKDCYVLIEPLSFTMEIGCSRIELLDENDSEHLNLCIRCNREKCPWIPQLLDLHFMPESIRMKVCTDFDDRGILDYTNDVQPEDLVGGL